MGHLLRSDCRNDALYAIMNSHLSFRSIVKNIAATILCLATSITSLSVTKTSNAAPKSIARLGNGKYLACVKKKQPDVYDESQTCFEFIKQGRNIKGGYEVTQEGPVVCVVGTIKRNIITGSVYDDSVSSAANGVPFDGIEELRSKLPTSTPTPLTTHLQVAEGKLEISKVGGQITYRKAVLNLNEFKYISSIKKINFTDCLK
jgi:hypothetical protein